MLESAIITGGTSGIGLATAKLMAASSKYRAIGILSRHKPKTGTECELFLGLNNSVCKHFECDVTNLSSINQSLKEFCSSFNVAAPGHLINCAGQGLNKLIVRTSAEEVFNIVNTNLVGSILTSKQCIELMLRAKTKGRIVNVGSVVGMTGNIGQSVYAASKAGLIGFTKSAAKELGSRGIYVNLVAPGYIKTPMTSTLNEYSLAQQIPLKRFADSEEIAQGIIFLLSNQASYVNGQILTIDGGLS